MRNLPLAAQLYIWGVVGVGGIVIALLLPSIASAEPDQLLLAMFLFVALLITETHQIPISYKTGVTVSTAVIFAAMLLLGPGLAALVAASGMGLAYIYLGRVWYNIVFNVSTYVLSIGFAAFAYSAGHGGEAPTLLSSTNARALILAGLGYAVVNTGLVSGIIALRRGRGVWHTWVSIFEQVAAEYVSLILLGILTTIVIDYAWWALLLIVFPVIIVYHSLRTSQELRVQTVEAVEALADAIDRRDPYTFEHSRRVADYAERTARQLNLPTEEVETIRLSARVHDLGKMGVSNEMLYKPDQFTVQEWEAIKQHVAVGADIVSRFPRYREGKDIILYHHEWYDGNGYPEGLKGDQIPIGARIIAVADAYDAMTTDRPYRSAWPPAKARQELQQCSGHQFDPMVVEAFFKALDNTTT